MKKNHTLILELIKLRKQCARPRCVKGTQTNYVPARAKGDKTVYARKRNFQEIDIDPSEDSSPSSKCSRLSSN